jgi:hypothetical protein
MYYSPAVYRDPGAFKPERFLPEQSAGRHPFALIPFNAGLRNCIGQNYGLFELEVMLSTLISRFRFSMDEATNVRTVSSSEIVQSQWLNYGQQIWPFVLIYSPHYRWAHKNMNKHRAVSLQQPFRELVLMRGFDEMVISEHKTVDMASTYASRWVIISTGRICYLDTRITKRRCHSIPLRLSNI